MYGDGWGGGSNGIPCILNASRKGTTNICISTADNRGHIFRSRDLQTMGWVLVKVKNYVIFSSTILLEANRNNYLFIKCIYGPRYYIKVLWERKTTAWKLLKAKTLQKMMDFQSFPKTNKIINVFKKLKTSFMNLKCMSTWRTLTADWITFHRKSKLKWSYSLNSVYLIKY